MLLCTISVLALWLTGNSQGRFYFFGLSTGRVISRNRATALTMPDEVIDQVHRIAWWQKTIIGMIFPDHNLISEEQDGDYSDEDAKNSDDNYKDDKEYKINNEITEVENFPNVGFIGVDNAPPPEERGNL